MLHNRATRGISKILLGNVVGQLVTLGLTPALFLYYTPSEFGEYSVLFALAALLATVSGWKLDLVIPIARTDGEAHLAATSALTLALPTTLLLGLPALLWLGNDLPLDAVTYLLLTFTTLTIIGYSIYSQLALRARDYKAIAVRNVTQPSITSAFQFLAAFVSMAPGLMLGGIAGRFVTTLTLRRRTRPSEQGPKLTLHCAVGFIRRHWRFPVLFGPSGLLNTLGAQLPILVGSSYLGVATTGLYVMGQRLTTAPVSLITSAFGQVIAAEIASRIRQGNSSNRRIYARFSLVLTCLGIAGALVTLFLIPRLLQYVLPSQADAVAAYMPALAIIVASTFVASPLSVVFPVYQAAWISLALDCSRVVLIWCAAQWALHTGHDGPGVFTAMALAQLANYAMSWTGGFLVVWRRQAHATTPDMEAQHG